MKRFLSLILVLSLALSLIALPAMAEGEAFTITVNLHGLDKSGGTANKIGPKHAEETTGVKINYYELDSASAGEKINIMLASGDLPDAFLSLLTETQVVSNLPMFVPLNEYLTEENAPNLMKMFEKYPELIDMITQVDGNIYTLPIGDFSNPDNQGEGIQVINKAWLDKLELEMPTTTEEFYQVCKAIKEGDPNGNGEADEIPVTFTQNNWAAHFINLLGPWGICEWEGGGDGYLKVEDGKAIFTATLPEFRAGLEYWHRMAAEGLLDVEGFTQTNEQFYARLKSYSVASYRGWTPASNFAAEQAAEFTTLPVLQASDYPEIKPVTPGEINKFCILTDSQSDRAGLLRDLDLDIAVIDRGEGFYECVPEGFTKATAIDVVLETYGLTLEDAYVFGDSTNDIAMFEHVPNAVLMGKHSPELEPYASFLTKNVEQDGIWYAMEKLGLLSEEV